MSEAEAAAGAPPSLFERWLEPARPRAKVWRLAAGLILAGVIWVIWQVAVIAGWLVFQAVFNGETWGGPEGDLNDLAAGATPAATLVLLLSFGGLWVGVFVALHALHRQTLKSLISWLGRFRAREFGAGAMIGAGYLALSTVAAFLTGATPERSELALDDWLFLLAPAIFCLLVQTGAEELLFRGYLTQQLAARFRSPIVWAGIPSVLFGVIHFANGSGVSTAYGLFYVGATLMIGLTCTVLVWRTGGLSAAIGLHFANNLGALFVMGTDGAMSSTQLWLWTGADAAATSPGELVMMVLLLAFVLSPWAPLPKRERVRAQVVRAGESGDS